MTARLLAAARSSRSGHRAAAIGGPVGGPVADEEGQQGPQPLAAEIGVDRPRRRRGPPRRSVERPQHGRGRWARRWVRARRRAGPGPAWPAGGAAGAGARTAPRPGGPSASSSARPSGRPAAASPTASSAAKRTWSAAADDGQVGQVELRRRCWPSPARAPRPPRRPGRGRAAGSRAAAGRPSARGSRAPARR